MNTWPDGEPVTPWADPWNDAADDIRRAADEYVGGLISSIPPEDQWIALCAKGRRAWCALYLMLRDEHVIDIRESSLIDQNSNDIVLVNLSRLDPEIRKHWDNPEAGT